MGQALDSIMVPTSFKLVVAGAFSSVAWPTGVYLVILFNFRFSVGQGPTATRQHFVFVRTSFLNYHVSSLDLLVLLAHLSRRLTR